MNNVLSILNKNIKYSEALKVAGDIQSELMGFPHRISHPEWDESNQDYKMALEVHAGKSERTFYFLSSAWEDAIEKVAVWAAQKEEEYDPRDVVPDHLWQTA